VTPLPLYPLDPITRWTRSSTEPVDVHVMSLKGHAELLQRDAWIIDGFGCVPSAWERFASADTLLYVDLSLSTHVDG
jgi:hypothetical protein